MEKSEGRKSRATVPLISLPNLHLLGGGGGSTHIPENGATLVWLF
jgi:hypothetical protein